MKRFQRVSRVAALAVVAAVLAGGCTSNSPTPIVDGTSATTAPGPEPTVTSDLPTAVLAGTVGAAPRLFDVTLSQGSAPAVAGPVTAVSSGQPLSDARRDELTGKLPKWDDPTSLSTPFNWPTQSSPPPRTGTVVSEPFPPAATPEAPTVDNGPLKILRVQPEGDVPVAPYFTVTFNQAMVPVGTVAQVTPAEAPVKLSPAVPGHWQWIGTRTLRFDSDSDTVDRLPMATVFTATVPAGTKSAAGATLAAAASYTFTTPTPTIKTFAPQQDNVALQPVFVATFDQRVDQADVLATIKLTAGGAVPVRLATTAEIGADQSAKNLTENAEPGRWVAFRPVRPMPTETTYTVDIGPGTPSAEGSRRTDVAQSFTGSTYGPLKVRRVMCAYGDQCTPGSPILIEFTNAIDSGAPGTSTAKVTVAPKLAAENVTFDGAVRIEGATQARTRYTVGLPATLTDVFGQTLGTNQTVTVTIGPAQPVLRQLDGITTLDPFAKDQKLSVLTTNHDQLRVRVFKADPANFSTYLRYAQSRYGNDIKMPSWTELSDRKISVSGQPDTTMETQIDLSRELGGKPGQVIVLAEPVPTVSPNDERYYENIPILTWVQSTAIALDSFTDGSDLRVWATNLQTGAPVKGIVVAPASTAGSGNRSATTNDVGLATVPLPNGDDVSYVYGSGGGETFVLPVNASKQAAYDELRWYAFDDRQIYRPGETMHLKGWVRQAKGSSSALSIAPLKTADYVVNDSYGVEVGRGTVPVGSLGGFDLAFDIPVTANVGGASVVFTTTVGGGSSSAHSFQIAEFRRPEFEVKVEPVTATPFVSTAPVTMSAQASYYAGGPLPNAPVAWSVSTSETTYSPVGWDAFTFGIFRPWWWDEGFVTNRSFPGSGTQNVKQYNGTTDASGRHALRLDFTTKTGTLPDLPVSVSVAGTVTDVNRQAWSDQRAILVHSANRYVGLRSDRSFVRQGDPLNIEAIVTDIDGKAQAGSKITVAAGLLRTSYVNGKSVEEVVDPQTCEVTTAVRASTCEFKTPVGGQYRISSTVTDAKGGRNRTELSVWVSGATSQAARTVEQEELTVVPDKKTYAPGDTARLLVQAPFRGGEGLIVVSRGATVRETTRFTATDGSAQIEVPISEDDIPGIGLTIEVVGATDRTGDDGKKVSGSAPRPAYAVGTLTLSVPPLSRTLSVTATPAQTELVPGGKTTITVNVKDAGGQAVQGAEFAVAVVDEAVLGLTNYQLPDPLEIFYGTRYNAVSTRFGRDQVQLVDPKSLVAPGVTPAPATPVADSPVFTDADADTTAAAASESAAAAPLTAAKAAGRAAGGSATAPVAVRSNFDALALFQPSVLTDASGNAIVDINLPDNLTRYRVMVVAVSGNDRFGTAESNITARLPLSVRPSAPRFLNTGDEFELPVVLQNSGKTAMSVELVIQAANLDTTGPTGRIVDVPAGDRVEVRFPAKVRSAGTARIRVSGFATSSSGPASDSAEVAIPVFTPGTAEAFATYGTIDNGAIRQPVLSPADVVDSYGGLEISTSSTSLQALTDALLYVSDYDYQSSDAYASRIMSISSLRGVLKDFKTADLPTEADLNATVERDIAGLVALQNDDGGWSYWRKLDRSEPFNSVQATHALIIAKQAGYAVSANALERALSYVSNVEQFIPTEYGETYRDMVRSYALWVSAFGGHRDPSKAAALFRERGEKLNLDAIAWLWSSLDDASAKTSIERTITNRAVDTAGAVSFTSGYTDSDYMTLGSDRRTDAIVLDALIQNVPKSDLVEKVVAGLLAHKTKGRWDNAQENTFALLAFKRYYDTYESVTPDFVARAWLGQQFAGEHTFKGRSTDRSVISVPMKPLIEGGNRDLVIAKDGTGRLYYRIGLRYVPADLTLEAMDRGFVMNRIYEGVDNKSDVTRDASGIWHIKAGAKVRVKLTMVAESQRTHVALVDPLPAGLEALNPTLAVSEPVVDNGQGTVTRKIFWWGAWYDHQQFRDDRSEAFTTYLPAGVYDYSYVARATTPGSFVVPPTRAEEMYAPETFGRTATDRVIIG